MTEKSTSQAEDGNPGWQALRKKPDFKAPSSNSKGKAQKDKPIPQRSNNREEKRERENLKPQISNQRGRETSKVE
ncbi:hypothetical protein J4864_09435 [Prevotella multiformis]|uniref:hypothetical protein n=1 Tax=Prevotella multiformis TaxID=282402 RepID=UPI001BA5DF31|nr:hypothetical protein [Prevotella multiformis]QUB71382.1 hypothetical protein J4864_09435 [Prevotella multiformis]